jgi:hypothetical protein
VPTGQLRREALAHLGERAVQYEGLPLGGLVARGAEHPSEVRHRGHQVRGAERVRDLVHHRLPGARRFWGVRFETLDDIPEYLAADCEDDVVH